MTFDGTTMPVLPAAIANLWSNSDDVANISMTYEADIMAGKIDAYAQTNLTSGQATGQLVAVHDGVRTVSIGLG